MKKLRESGEDQRGLGVVVEEKGVSSVFKCNGRSFLPFRFTIYPGGVYS